MESFYKFAFAFLLCMQISSTKSMDDITTNKELRERFNTNSECEQYKFNDLVSDQYSRSDEPTVNLEDETVVFK